MSDLRAVYLVSGDDDAKIDAWRARVRRRADAERGPGGLESFDASTTDPAELAAELARLSFATGTRYLVVEDVTAWRAGALGPLEESLAQMPPETVLVLIGRGKPVARLREAVAGNGGEVRDCAAPKPWEMPRWVAERAREEGLELDKEAARTLVTIVGTGQQRLAREIEKLALAAHPRRQLTADDVGGLASGETAPQVYDLADALVDGDREAALALAEELRVRDERAARLVFPIARRLRDVLRAATLLESGTSEQKLASIMKLPPWLAKRTAARARKADPEALERSLCALADLELELRGGTRLDDDTAFALALTRAAA